MKRLPKIDVPKAFDMVPMGGSVLMCYSPAELIEEADRRNARLSGEWYSVTILFSTKDRPTAIVTRSEQWAAAREERLMGLIKFAQSCI